MADDTIVVSVLLLDGSTLHLSVSRDATSQNLVDILTNQEEVKATALPDLPRSLWALQRVRREKSGRLWEQAALDALGDGTLLNLRPSDH